MGDLHDADLGALLTVPIAGWVSADTTGPTPSDGSGRGTRFLPPEATRGTLRGAPSLSDGTVYTDEFVDGVRRTLMPSGTVFFSLDNEPDLWSSTHSEIHPTAVTYAELVTRNVEHATAITSVVPAAVVFGPVNYGYAGFMNLQAASDAMGRDFIDFYLDAMSDAEDTARRRLVDVLDVHWYPEAQGRGRAHHRRRTGDAMATARMQAPRSLWDASVHGDQLDHGLLQRRRHPLDPAATGQDRRALPWHGHRHHRVQLRRGRAHLGRRGAGRRAGHLRTRARVRGHVVAALRRARLRGRRVRDVPRLRRCGLALR
ncbi:MAG: hypothetical protein IPI43_11790 [Sandaracinaceae bacterium]|nr:hypothetical protein [Sandaracinaceae bacterium]